MSRSSRQDPGPDGVTGTPDDGPFVTVYDYNAAYRGPAFTATTPVNRTGDQRQDTYKSLEFTATKRQTQRFPFNVVASMVATKNQRWLSPYVQSPNDEFFPLESNVDLVRQGHDELPRTLRDSGLGLLRDAQRHTRGSAPSYSGTCRSRAR